MVLFGIILGKCGSAGCFEIIYNYTVEMYPTVVRTTGLGLCSMAGRFGGILAPLVRTKCVQILMKNGK
jgi:hypothetical protein